jgi:hypothetical protein
VGSRERKEPKSVCVCVCVCMCVCVGGGGEKMKGTCSKQLQFLAKLNN